MFYCTYIIYIQYMIQPFILSNIFCQSSDLFDKTYNENNKFELKFISYLIYYQQYTCSTL